MKSKKIFTLKKWVFLVAILVATGAAAALYAPPKDTDAAARKQKAKIELKKSQGQEQNQDVQLRTITTPTAIRGNGITGTKGDAIGLSGDASNGWTFTAQPTTVGTGGWVYTYVIGTTAYVASSGTGGITITDPVGSDWNTGNIKLESPFDDEGTASVWTIGYGLTVTAGIGTGIALADATTATLTVYDEIPFAVGDATTATFTATVEDATVTDGKYLVAGGTDGTSVAITRTAATTFTVTVTMSSANKAFTLAYSTVPTVTVDWDGTNVTGVAATSPAFPATLTDNTASSTDGSGTIELTATVTDAQATKGLVITNLTGSGSPTFTLDHSAKTISIASITQDVAFDLNYKTLEKITATFDDTNIALEDQSIFKGSDVDLSTGDPYTTDGTGKVVLEATITNTTPGYAIFQTTSVPNVVIDNEATPATITFNSLAADIDAISFGYERKVGTAIAETSAETLASAAQGQGYVASTEDTYTFTATLDEGIATAGTWKLWYVNGGDQTIPLKTSETKPYFEVAFSSGSTYTITVTGAAAGLAGFASATGDIQFKVGYEEPVGTTHVSVANINTETIAAVSQGAGFVDAAATTYTFTATLKSATATSGTWIVQYDNDGTLTPIPITDGNPHYTVSAPDNYVYTFTITNTGTIAALLAEDQTVQFKIGYDEPGSAHVSVNNITPLTVKTVTQGTGYVNSSATTYSFTATLDGSIPTGGDWIVQYVSGETNTDIAVSSGNPHYEVNATSAPTYAFTITNTAIATLLATDNTVKFNIGYTEPIYTLTLTVTGSDSTEPDGSVDTEPGETTVEFDFFPDVPDDANKRVNVAFTSVGPEVDDIRFVAATEGPDAVAAHYHVTVIDIEADNTATITYVAKTAVAVTPSIDPSLGTTDPSGAFDTDVNGNADFKFLPGLNVYDVNKKVVVDFSAGNPRYTVDPYVEPVDLDPGYYKVNLSNVIVATNATVTYVPITVPVSILKSTAAAELISVTQGTGTATQGTTYQFTAALETSTAEDGAWTLSYPNPKGEGTVEIPEEADKVTGYPYYTVSYSDPTYTFTVTGIADSLAKGDPKTFSITVDYEQPTISLKAGTGLQQNEITGDGVVKEGETEFTITPNAFDATWLLNFTLNGTPLNDGTEPAVDVDDNSGSGPYTVTVSDITTPGIEILVTYTETAPTYVPVTVDPSAESTELIEVTNAPTNAVEDEDYDFTVKLLTDVPTGGEWTLTYPDPAGSGPALEIPLYDDSGQELYYTLNDAVDYVFTVTGITEDLIPGGEDEVAITVDYEVTPTPGYPTTVTAAAGTGLTTTEGTPIVVSDGTSTRTFTATPASPDAGSHFVYTYKVGDADPTTNTPTGVTGIQVNENTWLHTLTTTEDYEDASAPLAITVSYEAIETYTVGLSVSPSTAGTVPASITSDVDGNATFAFTPTPYNANKKVVVTFTPLADYEVEPYDAEDGIYTVNVSNISAAGTAIVTYVDITIPVTASAGTASEELITVTTGTPNVTQGTTWTFDAELKVSTAEDGTWTLSYPNPDGTGPDLTIPEEAEKVAGKPYYAVDFADPTFTFTVTGIADSLLAEGVTDFIITVDYVQPTISLKAGTGLEQNEITGDGVVKEGETEFTINPAGFDATWHLNFTLNGTPLDDTTEPAVDVDDNEGDGPYTVTVSDIATAGIEILVTYTETTPTYVPVTVDPSTGSEELIKVTSAPTNAVEDEDYNFTVELIGSTRTEGDWTLTYPNPDGESADLEIPLYVDGSTPEPYYTLDDTEDYVFTVTGIAGALIPADGNAVAITVDYQQPPADPTITVTFDDSEITLEDAASTPLETGEPYTVTGGETEVVLTATVSYVEGKELKASVVTGTDPENVDVEETLTEGEYTVTISNLAADQVIAFTLTYAATEVDHITIVEGDGFDGGSFDAGNGEVANNRYVFYARPATAGGTFQYLIDGTTPVSDEFDVQEGQELGLYTITLTNIAEDDLSVTVNYTAPVVVGLSTTQTSYIEIKDAAHENEISSLTLTGGVETATFTADVTGLQDNGVFDVLVNNVSIVDASEGISAGVTYPSDLDPYYTIVLTEVTENVAVSVKYTEPPLVTLSAGSQAQYITIKDADDTEVITNVYTVNGDATFTATVTTLTAGGTLDVLVNGQSIVDATTGISAAVTDPQGLIEYYKVDLSRVTGDITVTLNYTAPVAVTVVEGDGLSAVTQGAGSGAVGTTYEFTATPDPTLLPVYAYEFKVLFFDGGTQQPVTGVTPNIGTTPDPITGAYNISFTVPTGIQGTLNVNVSFVAKPLPKVEASPNIALADLAVAETPENTYTVSITVDEYEEDYELQFHFDPTLVVSVVTDPNNPISATNTTTTATITTVAGTDVANTEIYVSYAKVVVEGTINVIAGDGITAGEIQAGSGIVTDGDYEFTVKPTIAGNATTKGTVSVRFTVTAQGQEVLTAGTFSVTGPVDGVYTVTVTGLIDGDVNATVSYVNPILTYTIEPEHISGTSTDVVTISAETPASESISKGEISFVATVNSGLRPGGSFAFIFREGDDATGPVLSDPVGKATATATGVYKVTVSNIKVTDLFVTVGYNQPPATPEAVVTPPVINIPSAPALSEVGEGQIADGGARPVGNLTGATEKATLVPGETITSVVPNIPDSFVKSTPRTVLITFSGALGFLAPIEVSNVVITKTEIKVVYTFVSSTGTILGTRGTTVNLRASGDQSYSIFDVENNTLYIYLVDIDINTLGSDESQATIDIKDGANIGTIQKAIELYDHPVLLIPDNGVPSIGYPGYFTLGGSYPIDGRLQYHVGTSDPFKPYLGSILNSEIARLANGENLYFALAGNEGVPNKVFIYKPKTYENVGGGDGGSYIPSLPRNVFIEAAASSSLSFNPVSGQGITTDGNFTFTVIPETVIPGYEIALHFYKDWITVDANYLPVYDITPHADGSFTVTLANIKVSDLQIVVEYRQGAVGNASVGADKVWANGNTLFINSATNGTAKVYSIAGGLVKTVKLDANTVTTAELPQGTYIVVTPNGKTAKVNSKY